MATEKHKSDAENSPVAWFAVLERARNTNDFPRAAHAVEELRRLGVTVKFTRQARMGAGHAA